MISRRTAISTFVAAVGTALMPLSASAADGQPFAPAEAGAANQATEADWNKVSRVLDGYKGVYTRDTRIGSPWNTAFNPDGPIMGNGTTFAFMAGDHRTQNIYVSRSDMWRDRSSRNGQQYTAFGGLTIRADDGIDLAQGKPVQVSGFTSSNEDGPKLVDGRDDTKWCSTVATNGGSAVYWAVVDLGQAQNISRWVVKHASAGGETAQANTKDFRLQYSTKSDPKGGVDADWTDADTVTGNSAAVTDRNLATPITTRYVRLQVTTAEQGAGNTLRIYGLDLYAQPKLAAQSDFRYEQDMRNAEVLAQSEGGFTTFTWLSARENLIITLIKNTTAGRLPLEVSNWTVNSNAAAEVRGNMMVATKSGTSASSNRASGDGTWPGWTVNVAMASKVIGNVKTTVTAGAGSTNRTNFTLDAGQSVTVVSAIEGGKQSATANSMGQAIDTALAKVASRSHAHALASAQKAHRAYWKQYWLKSFIHIHDSKVERMYYGLLYELGCATSASSENNAGLPPGLFPWTANDNPAWQGDYTTNTDMQRQVDSLMTANRLDGVQNYVNLLEQYWPEAQRRSASAQNLNWVIQGTGRPTSFTDGINSGALVPTHIGPWGASTEQYNDSREYWNSPADASSVLMPLVKMFQYNQDDGFLKEHLYPMLRSVAVFWENYVTLENGKYVVYGATHEGVAGRNPIFDVDAAGYILRNAVDAAKQLRVDSDRVSAWQHIVDNMSAQPTFLYNGKVTICDVEGRTQANPGSTFDSNPVTIQSVYYYDSVGMSAPPTVKEKYFNYLAVKNGMGTARRLTSATRLGYDIHEIMDHLRIGSIDPAPGDWAGLRGNNTVGDLGAVNLLGVVQESLLQSNEGFVNVFANWYKDQAASFTRLRANGAFLIDASQDASGTKTFVGVRSEKGKELSILNPWQGRSVGIFRNGHRIAAKSTRNPLGEILTIPTKAGSYYELRVVRRQQAAG
ncbi:discoidin domain-containing protein [Embleya scabrispora]|uniref:discoidin domain-containing protein n=1 Tax=Embleya scabrispora TaxID=159449 RepID=UPI00039D9D18|nr:discoidin domain-containing protein [Embleya scabrispora]MYS82063.1 hypothetical protein [Streptomyces sp. SID5474]